jgi:hypothetical protein
MSALIRSVVVVLLLGVAAVAVLGYVKATGLKSQPDPGALETRVARAVRASLFRGHQEHAESGRALE